MIGGKSASKYTPTALGSMVNASTYGQTIPIIYGRTRASLYAIWAANLRKGNSGKKGKKDSKKSPPNYVENIDFLLATNPMVSPLQMWNNNATKAPLNFLEHTVSFPASFPTNITIPDAHYYCLIGVTVTLPYSVTFNDYGGTGPQTLTGTFEAPLWNAAFLGPDPTDPSYYRNFPYVYYWQPGSGATVSFGAALSAPEFAGATNLNLYYAQTSTTISNETPAQVLRLTYEPTLGDGPEYSGSPEQILYPWYTGLGSPDIDLGASGMIPNIMVETLGTFPIYSTGDADFSDMIEDIAKSGQAQAAFGGNQSLALIQHGASLFDYPGPVQKKGIRTLFSTSESLHPTFDLPNNAGDFLLVFFATTGVGASGITGVIDTAGNTWDTLEIGFDSGTGYGWIIAIVKGCVASGAGNQLTIQTTGGGLSNIAWQLTEIAGVDTFDSFVAQTFSTSGQIDMNYTTGNRVGQPEIVVAFVLNEALINITEVDPRWNDLMGAYAGLSGGPGSGDTSLTGTTFSQWKTVWGPTTVNLSVDQGGFPARVFVIGMKQVAPAPYPAALGSIIDKPSMQLCKTQARANGLYGSLNLNSQSSCRELMTTLYSSLNSVPFYSGNLLKQAPKSEVSAVGNGAIYTAPTASGPIASFSIDGAVTGGGVYGDFIGDKDNSPITVERTAQLESLSIMQYQIPGRSSDYNPVNVSEPETGGLTLYGVRKAEPQVHNEIQDASIARKLLAIAVRNQQHVRDNYKGKIGPRALLIEPMDLVTMNDPAISLNVFPVRPTSLTIGADWNVTFEADPFFYGLNAPDPITATTPQPYAPGFGGDPGSVNTPVIFEAVPRLYNSGTQGEIWIAVSGSNVNYGGCIVLVSTDGGSSYNPAISTITGTNTILGNGITGYTTADWPSADDPDTTNNLPVDLTESNGILNSYTAADRDAFTYPCYVEGGNANIPYALMTYNSATLTATSKYTLNATGSGNELRRCVYGAPVSQPGPDVDHPGPSASPPEPGSRFAWLGNPSSPGPGVITLPLLPTYIGKTLYFKFLAFNTFQGNVQSESDAVAYAFTPSGSPGGGVAQNNLSYSVVDGALAGPGQPTAFLLGQFPANQILLRGSGPGQSFGMKFSTNTAMYNGRAIAIPAPSAPIWYYVTIYDPGYTGDAGLSNLPTYADTTQSKIGQPGYIYCGAIQCLPSGFTADIILPGGYPPPTTNIIGS